MNKKWKALPWGNIGQLEVYRTDWFKEVAKAFLRWLYDDKQMSRWLASANAYYAPFLHGYDNHPMWNVEPRYLPYKESLKTSRPHTWPGPQGHAASENVAKYVLVDMFAKACRGDSTKDVIATAAAQLKQIYKAK